MANADNSHSVTISPSPNGNVSSVVSNIRVFTDGAQGYDAGYELTLQSIAANMVGQAHGNALVPINGTINNPTIFTTENCNAWGFATPRVSGGNSSEYFDANYAIESNKGVGTSASRYAAVPTTATHIHGSHNKDETRPYYFAACVNSTLPADTYTATIIWTAYARGEGDDWSGDHDVVVDIDPGMIPVRWNYDECTYGNGYGNVMASTPTTNTTPTDLNSWNISSTACWVKADPDIHGTFTNDDWYNYTTDNTATRDSYGQPYYTHRKMANAVTFTDITKLANYRNAAVGTPILEADIAGYWTYVPRFAYAVENFNYNSANYPHAFDLRLANATGFLLYDDVSSIDTAVDPNALNPPTGSNPMTLHPTTYQYLTPPAFIRYNGDGSRTDLNGLWFGKYETTIPNYTPTVKAGRDPVSSATGAANVSTLFGIGLLFGNSSLTGSTQSFTGSNVHNFADISKVKSHMTKNSEWGALVYFTNSMYGVCSNMNCTSNDIAATDMAATAYTERVRNNAETYYPYTTTGCGPNTLNPTDDTTTDTCSPYNTQLGVLASTTHNVYGIYDTAGGVWEYTTGVYATGNGSAANAYTPVSAGSGFTNLPGMLQTDAAVYLPYFDVYPSPSLTDDAFDIASGNYGLGSSAITSNSSWNIYAGKLGLGQGIFEAAWWNGDYSVSIYATNSWFVRGGFSDSTTYAGVGAIGDVNGSGSGSFGFRAVLTPLP